MWRLYPPPILGISYDPPRTHTHIHTPSALQARMRSPAVRKRVDPERAVRFKGTEIFPLPRSAHSAAHWAELSAVMAQHPGWKYKQRFLHTRGNRESVVAAAASPDLTP